MTNARVRIHCLVFAMLCLSVAVSLDASPGSRRRAVRHPEHCFETSVVTHAEIIDIAVDSSHAYYGDYQGNLARVRKGGGTEELLMSRPGTWTMFLTIDDVNVYFVSRSQPGQHDSIYSVPKEGGEPTLLLGNVLSPTELVSDGEWLYIVSAGSYLGSATWRADGEIIRVAKDGMTIETIAEGLRVPTDMAIDGDTIYFIEYGTSMSDTSGGLRRMQKGSEEVVSVASIPHAWALADDTTSMYVFRLIPGSGESGAIDAVLKSEGLVSTLVSGIHFEVVQPMEVFGNVLYYMNLIGEGLAQIEGFRLTDGGTYVVQQFEPGFPQFAIDSCGVYFSTPAGINRVAR